MVLWPSGVMVRTFDLGHDLWQAVHAVCLCHQALVWHQSNGSDALHCSWTGNSGSSLALTGHGSHTKCSNYRLKTYGREMSSLLYGVWHSTSYRSIPSIMLTVWQSTLCATMSGWLFTRLKDICCAWQLPCCSYTPAYLISLVKCLDRLSKFAIH